jgi:hypothetical protein
MDWTTDSSTHFFAPWRLQAMVLTFTFGGVLT